MRKDALPFSIRNDPVVRESSVFVSASKKVATKRPLVESVSRLRTTMGIVSWSPSLTNRGTLALTVTDF